MRSVSYREKIRDETAQFYGGPFPTGFIYKNTRLETDLQKIEQFHSGYFPGMKRTSFRVRFIPGKNQLGRELDSFTVGSGFFLDSVALSRLKSITYVNPYVLSLLQIGSHSHIHTTSSL